LSGNAVKSEEISLFNGRELGNWKVTPYGGEGEVSVEDGNLILDYGNELSGVTWQGPLPAVDNYEIELEAMRLDGNDFFLGLTFPVSKSSASLVLGGWGGSLCGISSIDDNDAANNETQRIIHFKNKRWYKVKLKVSTKRIQVYLDSKEIIDVVITGKKIGVRPEVELSQPMGLSSFGTRSAYRNIVFRKFTLEP